jgi:hypothetical protein
MTSHRLLLFFLYTLTLLAILYISMIGNDYYSELKIERPHHEMHSDWKPGGVVGHGLGIVGSSLLLILFIYSARKRFRFMSNWGNIRKWLNLHIWMGISGPLLVIYHTSFKFHGIVAISFWSMIAVALSGVLGRYVYMQIPHSLNGKELSPDEIAKNENSLLLQLKDDFGVSQGTIESIYSLVGRGDSEGSAKLKTIFSWIVSDISLPFSLPKIRRRLAKVDGCDRKQIAKTVKLARRLAMFRRRRAFLKQSHDILHYWHIIHRPFAAVMILFMIVHVVVAILFGYRWVF